MIAVALVPISQATGTPTSAIVWLVAGLYLASAITQPMTGRLVDLFGPRWVCIAGMLLAGLAGLVPLLLPTFAGALISRIGIGIGSAAAYPSAMASIRLQSARVGREPPRALFSALSVANLTTAAAGPVLGGALVQVFGWQAVFVVNTPYAAIVIAGVLIGVPSGRTGAQPTQRSVGALDLPGLALFAVAMGAALGFVLDLAAARYWLLPISLAAFAGLVVRELRARTPFLDLRMLAARGDLVRTYGRLFFVYTATYLMIYGFIQWLQSAGGYAPDAAGWMQFPAVVIAGLAAASLARTRRVVLPLIVAAAATVVGGAVVLFVTADAAVWLLVVAMAIFGVPQGFASVANQAVLYAQAPPDRLGSTAALSRTAVQMGAVIASSIIGAVFGEAPSDTELHVMAWTICGLGACALALTAFDRGLRRAEIP